MFLLYILSCIPFIIPPIVLLSREFDWMYVYWIAAALVWPLSFVVVVMFLAFASVRGDIR